MYARSNMVHNGGGWIASLESLVRKTPDVKLGIAFEHSDKRFRVDRDGIAYYPINVWRSKWKRLKRKIIYDTEERLLIPACLRIIEDFKPDVINVFGSEWCFGLVREHMDIPVVIHMQGSIPPYYNARFPAGYSRTDLVFYYGLNIRKTLNQLLWDRAFRLRAKREERILRGCQYFMGRTEWDKNVTRLYAPESEYFYCSEALRDAFVNTDRIWQPHNRINVVFVTTISPPLYKGADVILKTAKLLQDNRSINFEWRVFGAKEIRFHEWKVKIKASEVNVRLMGTVSEARLRDELLDADIFIHPSYIDNSPNSICEAQYLGVPVISTNVGGIGSLVKHHETGFLVPSNDPYSMASYILLVINDKDLSASLGRNAREAALVRHSPKQILNDLLTVYNKIIDQENKNK